MPAGAQQTQALLQVFANCIQGLSTAGPLTINGGASRYPPRGGVLSSPPGLGSPVTQPPSTGDTLTDYLNGRGDSGGGYPPGTWNVVLNGDNITNNYGGPISITYGGDTQYGDTYQNINNLGDYFTYNNYNNNVSNSVHNENVSNWYEQYFQDNSYNDFSTNLTTTSNYLTNTYNNVEGDTVFNNTNTTNTTVNQGDVFNLSNVFNEGDVYNEGDTYHNANNTYIYDGSVTVNLQSYITSLIVATVNNITQTGQGGKIPNGATFSGKEQAISFTVKEFDPETCQNNDVTKEIKFTPEGEVNLTYGNAPQQ